MARGYCTINGKTSMFSRQADCVRAGGHWNDTPPLPGPDDLGCFLSSVITPALGVTLRNVGAVTDIAYEFRDKVLDGSVVGEELILRYYDYSNDLTLIALKDVELLGGFFQLYLDSLEYVDAVLVVQNGAKVAEEVRTMRLPDKLYQKFQGLLRRTIELSENDELSSFLEELILETERYQGVTADEFLSIIRRESIEA